MGNGFIKEETFDKITDPLGVFGGKAGRWADPAGWIIKEPKKESAADRAARLEEERQAQIRKTQGEINAVFNDPRREGEIADFVDATRQYYRQGLDDQKGETDRDLKFAMARAGLTGGSVQRDKNTDVAEQYARGLIDVNQKALGAGSALRAQEQEARARLIALATSGLDATNAANQASAAMRSNLESQRTASRFDAPAQAFGTFQNYLTRAQETADRRRANQDSGFGPYGSAMPYGG